LIFIDTSGIECRQEKLVATAGRLSLQNKLEARVVQQLVYRLVECGVLPQDVGILTAYGAQRDLLVYVLHPASSDTPACRRWQKRAARILLGDADPNAGDPHPRVHTVDGFQGSEQEYIIFSAVRSGGKGSAGFVGDPRRVCVLLTRARKGLIIVGDRSMLQRDAEWGHWLKNAAASHVDANSVLHPSSTALAGDDAVLCSGVELEDGLDGSP